MTLIPQLLINVDHVATLRNARQECFPDPVAAAVLCEMAGAHGIVFHLREDRRHINERDVRLLRETVRGKLDFELSTNEEVVDICCRTQPHLATLVPERREEVTTEGGIDVVQHRDLLQRTVDTLHTAGVTEVATFVDPDHAQIDASLAIGADAIELHTGDFAVAATGSEQLERARQLATAAAHAHAVGLKVHAGHGLDYLNYGLFRSVVKHVSEVSIGFAVIARAVLVGLDVAVRDMLRLVKGG